MTKNCRRLTLSVSWQEAEQSSEERPTLLPDAWNALGPIRRRMAVHYLRFLILQQIFNQAPGFVRLTVIHGLVVLVTIGLLPPPPSTPPVAIPLIWPASLGVAIAIYSISPILK